jgi:hypothetical protein
VLCAANLNVASEIMASEDSRMVLTRIEGLSGMDENTYCDVVFIGFFLLPLHWIIAQGEANGY